MTCRLLIVCVFAHTIHVYIYISTYTCTYIDIDNTYAYHIATVDR